MVFVTGGTGLLGSHLIVHLIRNGEEVRALYRDKKKIDKRKKHLLPEEQALYERAEWVEGNILDIHSLEDQMVDVDHVYHCAAKVSFNPKHKDHLVKINIEGTANVVNTAINCGVKKLCHVSSVSALGKPDKEKFITEESSWLEKKSRRMS